jgi:hypothetical protein
LRFFSLATFKVKVNHVRKFPNLKESFLPQSSKISQLKIF